MRRTFDVVVVGNGVLGLSIARELSRPGTGARVALVGPPARSGSASTAAGAMLNVWAEMEPGCLEDPVLAARFSVPRRSLDLWPAHAAALAEESGLPVAANWGTYVVSGPRGPSREEVAFEYMIAALRFQNRPVEEVPVRDLGFLAANPATRPMRAARVPDGAVDSRAVVAALDAIVRRGTCEVVERRAIGLTAEASGDRVVRLEDGSELAGPCVVLANGAYAQALVDEIPQLKSTVPRLLFGSGAGADVSFAPATYLPPELGALRCVVRTMDRGGGCGMHLIPYGDGRFYLGASSGVWLSPEDQVRVHALAALLNGAVAEFHHAFFHAHVRLRALGHRPVSLDTFPLLGESAVRGVWFCNGTKRDGFTCSPLLARELAAAILGGRADLPDVFRPSRELISYRGRQFATDAAARVAIDGELMNGLSPAANRWGERERHHRHRVEAVYDRRGIAEFGIHPEVLHLYESDEWYRVTAHPRDRP